MSSTLCDDITLLSSHCVYLIIWYACIITPGSVNISSLCSYILLYIVIYIYIIILSYILSYIFTLHQCYIQFTFMHRSCLIDILPYIAFISQIYIAYCIFYMDSSPIKFIPCCSFCILYVFAQHSQYSSSQYVPCCTHFM